MYKNFKVNEWTVQCYIVASLCLASAITVWFIPNDKVVIGTLLFKLCVFVLSVLGSVSSIRYRKHLSK